MNPVTSAGRTGVDIGAIAKLELVDKFSYLGDMLSMINEENEWDHKISSEQFMVIAKVLR